MGKRFSETVKWADKWFRSLSTKHKLAWYYVLENCDAAGVIDIDRELADFQIGDSVDWDAFLKAAGHRIESIGRGKWWLTGFIAFQYGRLSEECNAHKPVFASLEKHQLTARVLEGYLDPTSRVQDKDKDKDKDKEKKKEGGAGETNPAKLPPSIDTPPMAEAVTDWLAYKRERREAYKPTGLKNFLSHLANAVAVHGEQFVVERMRTAMASGWKGWDHEGRGSPPRSGRDGNHSRKVLEL